MFSVMFLVMFDGGLNTSLVFWQSFFYWKRNFFFAVKNPHNVNFTLWSVLSKELPSKERFSLQFSTKLLRLSAWEASTSESGWLICNLRNTRNAWCVCVRHFLVSNSTWMGLGIRGGCQRRLPAEFFNSIGRSPITHRTRCGFNGSQSFSIAAFNIKPLDLSVITEWESLVIWFSVARSSKMYIEPHKLLILSLNVSRTIEVRHYLFIIPASSLTILGRALLIF